MLGDTLRWATELDASGFASGAQRVNSSLGEMGFRTSAATMNLGGLGTMIGSLANPMTLAAGAAMALGAALTGSVQAAAAWETSMSGVSKTAGLTGEDLNGLSKELLDMSTRMPAAASEIANVAQVAGSLGIGQEFAAIGDFEAQTRVIAEFTEVAIQMGVGFEMSADQAATAGAKILTAFKLETTAENMEKLGSVVNAMGDSFAATEPQVLDFLNRASFLNTTMGQTIPQIAALGTVLISTGLDADVAATGLKSFLNMATSETSKKGGLDNWAKLMNISVEELKANLAGDFNQTLIDTANAIAAIEDPVERFQKAVALAGTEGAPAILKLAGQQENLQKALGMTNDEWERAQSLQKTYAAQSETFNSKMQIFWNTINMAGVELGSVLLPGLTQAIEDITTFANITIDAAEALYDWVAAWDKAFGRKDAGRAGLSVEDLAEYEKMGVTLTEEERARVHGSTYADAAAKEIEENDKLKAAVDLSNPENMEAARKAGIKLGEETGDAMAEAMTVTMINQAAGVSTAWADSISQAMKDYGVGMLYTGGGNSRWKDSIGQVFGSTVYESVGIAAVKEATVSSTYMVLKTENGKELARRNIHSGEFAGNPVGAIYDMIKETTELKGLSDIESAELAGDLGKADILKLQGTKIEAELSISEWISKEAVNDSLANIIDKGPIIQKHKEDLEAIAKEDAAAYQSALFGAFGDKADIPSLADIIASGGEGIADVAAWMANEYQPALSNEMESMNKLWDSGLTANRKIVEEDLDLLQETFENHSNWFEDWQQDLIAIYEEGDITTDQFLDMWNEYGKKADEAATAASETVLAADEKFYGSILDSSRTWQDYVNEEGGFVGPTEMYAGYALNKIDRMSASHQINQMFGVAEVGSVGMVADLDTSEALGASEALVSDIEALVPDMTLNLNIDSALTAWVNFFADIETINPTMHVNVEVDANAQDIAAKVEQAIVEALA